MQNHNVIGGILSSVLQCWDVLGPFGNFGHPDTEFTGQTLGDLLDTTISGREVLSGRTAKLWGSRRGYPEHLSNHVLYNLYIDKQWMVIHLKLSTIFCVWNAHALQNETLN